MRYTIVAQTRAIQFHLPGGVIQLPLLHLRFQRHHGHRRMRDFPCLDGIIGRLNLAHGFDEWVSNRAKWAVLLHLGMV